MKDFLLKLNKKQKIMIIVGIFLTIIAIFLFLYKTFYATNENLDVISSDKANTGEDSEEYLGDEYNSEEYNSGEYYSERYDSQGYYSEGYDSAGGNNIKESGNSGENSQTQSANSKLGITVKKNRVVVHVIGEVNNPGVVILNEGARIIDAINATGGKTEEADLSKINLAYIIEDGVQIYVPRIGENINNDSNTNNEQNETKYIREDAGAGIITESAEQENDTAVEIKVNINTATKEKLETLPGIGESTAQKIIEYRNKNGKFKSEEDLKNVSGIGESKYNSLKDKITVK